MKWDLKKRGKTYYVRVYIPASLQKLHKTRSGKPKTEIVRSLKTHDRKEANEQASALVPDLVKEIYKLPDPKDYAVQRHQARVPVYRDLGQKQRFEDEPVQIGEAVIVVEDHEELSYVAEEIEEIHGEKIAKAWAQKASGKINLANAAHQYRKHVELRNLNSERTRNTQETHQNEFAEWCPDKSESLEDVSLLDAAEYCDHLLEQGMAPKTFNARVSSLSVLWRWAKSKGLVQTNIWSDRNVPSTTAKEPRAFNGDEIKSIQKALKASTKKAFHYDLFTLLVFTGCRIEEVCSLKVEQITRDSETQKITGFTAFGGKPGKGSKHWIPVLAPAAVSVLIDRVDGKKPGDRLFHEFVKGSQGWSHNVAKSLRRAMRKALGLPTTGVCDVDNHSYRRTHATAAENAGLAPHEIDRLQRRKTNTIAGDIYSDGPTAEIKMALQQRVTDELVAKYW